MERFLRLTYAQFHDYSSYLEFFRGEKSSQNGEPMKRRYGQNVFYSS